MILYMYIAPGQGQTAVKRASKRCRNRSNCIYMDFKDEYCAVQYTVLIQLETYNLASSAISESILGC